MAEGQQIYRQSFNRELIFELNLELAKGAYLLLLASIHLKLPEKIIIQKS